jgi:hypothetical protein
MVRIRIEVGPDTQLCTAAESYVHSGHRWSTRALALSPVIVGVLLLFAGGHAWLMSAGLIIVGLVEATILPWLVPRMRGRAWARNPRHPRMVELRDEDVRSVSATYDLTRPWVVFDRIVPLPGQYLLMMGKTHYISVPTGGLSPDESAELRDFLNGRGAALLGAH